MNFNELLNLVSSDNTPDICVDSRAVGDGDIFVAVKGTACDGHDFIDQALDNGAEYIVCQQNTQYATCPEYNRRIRDTQYELIVVDDTTEAAAILAQTVRGNP